MNKKALKMLVKALCVDGFKAEEVDGKMIISGYASVFGKVDSYGDTILKGAFKNFLKTGEAVAMLGQHERQMYPVGVWTELKEDEKGLFVTGELFNTDRGIEIYKVAKGLSEAGQGLGLSIGYGLTKDDFDETDKGRTIKNVTLLREISHVTFAADKHAFTTEVKSSIEKADSLKDFERILRDSGAFSKSEATAIVSGIKNCQGDPDIAISTDEVKKILAEIEMKSFIKELSQ